MGEKVIITSNSMGAILLAIVVKKEILKLLKNPIFGLIITIWK